MTHSFCLYDAAIAAVMPPTEVLLMEKIVIKSFAKINLTLDVLGVLENGYHELAMIMQQILLCDDVQVKWTEAQRADSGSAKAGVNVEEAIKIELSTNRKFLPTDSRNLAYKAAAAMIERYGEGKAGTIRIDIKKRIPIAAGLAGGSGNAAAVLHGINKLWGLGLDVAALCEIGKTFGSDIPFCIMGQAAGNEVLADDFRDDPLACHCALATGTGTDLQPITGLKSHLVLSKPNIGVSTAEVYKGIDNMEITVHPNNDEMIDALKKNDTKVLKKNLINVLENFTLNHYPIVMYTKNILMEHCSTGCVLMSGSGPTVFGLCKNITESKAICEKMLSHNKESFWTRTTW